MRRWLVKLLPNTLTLTRLILCPFILVLLLEGRAAWGLRLFFAGCLTDLLDGYFARKLDAKTALGEVLDPVCDKLFVLSFFSLLMTFGACPAWFLGLVISVAMFQCFGFVVIKASHPREAISFGAAPIGKWNTALQLAWIALLLLDVFLLRRDDGALRMGHWIYELGYIGLTGLQLTAFFRYFFRFRARLAPHFRPFAHHPFGA